MSPPFWISELLLIDGRTRGGGSDRIDIDVIGTPFYRERPGQVGDTPLTGCIGRSIPEPNQPNVELRLMIFPFF